MQRRVDRPHRRSARLLALVVAVAALGCGRAPEDGARATAAPPQANPAPPPADEVTGPLARKSDAQACAAPVPPTRVPAAPRIVAIGDVHGDLPATRRALRLAGAIDEHDRWVGGELVVVQTGDVLDRGDDEQAILDLLARLAGEARAAGGAVHVLHGNHELMNAAGDFRYVTPGALKDFAEVAVDAADPRLRRLPAELRARAAALFPGGPYAQRLAAHPTVLVVGDTVFAHGGVLPTWADDLERLNHEVACWLLGDGPMPEVVAAPDGPVWDRQYSIEPVRCDLLEAALDRLGARRMVVGHTTQRTGITQDCDGRIWRIDVGLAAHYGGTTQILELTASGPRILAAP